MIKRVLRVLALIVCTALLLPSGFVLGRNHLALQAMWAGPRADTEPWPGELPRLLLQQAPSARQPAIVLAPAQADRARLIYSVIWLCRESGDLDQYPLRIVEQSSLRPIAGIQAGKLIWADSQMTIDMPAVEWCPTLRFQWRWG